MSSSSRDNWERLVVAVLQREKYRQLCYAESRSPSICSVASSDDQEIPKFPHSELDNQLNMMSIVQKTEHDCYEHYELRNYEKVFTCDGCKMNGFGQMYQCKLCGHGLHRECRFPRTTISHEHFEGAIFTFHEEPFTRIGINNRREYSKCCDACAKDICGFSYHCEADDLDLHPCCRNLEKKLVINDAVINLPAKSSSKCIWCKKRKISDGCRDVPGWSYSLVSIDDNEYHLHVYCMTEMMHEACMKNEEMTLENIEPRKVAKSSRNRENGANKIFETIKTKRFRKSY